MSGPNDNYDPKQVAALSAESLDAIVADALAAFVAEQIGPLLDCDAREGGHLCSTLEVYLGVGNGAEAARRLFVHYNTLKHRLARISALLDTDLRDARRRAALTLALAGRHLGSPVPARGRT